MSLYSQYATLDEVWGAPPAAPKPDVVNPYVTVAKAPEPIETQVRTVLRKAYQSNGLNGVAAFLDPEVVRAMSKCDERSGAAGTAIAASLRDAMLGDDTLYLLLGVFVILFLLE